MSSLFNLPYQQVFDSSGNTLAGAKLYFYFAGTSTLKNVFANVNLTTSLPNPVVANGEGRFVPIYMDDTAYKIILYDANGSLIWSADNVLTQPVDSDAAFVSNAVKQVITSAGYSEDQVSVPENFPRAIYKYANSANFYDEKGSSENVYILNGLDNYIRPTDYFKGMSVYFISSRKNTGNATINVSDLGVKNVRRFDGSDLKYGDLYGIVHLIYNGTVFLLANNDKTNLPRFCVNSGNLNVSGNADILTHTGNTVIFKVGESYPSLTVTNSLGETAIIDAIANHSVSGDGIHVLYTDLTGRISDYTTLFTIGKTYPANPHTNQVFYNLSGVPEAKIWSGTNWDSFALIPLGYVIVSNGNISEIASYQFNYDRYNLTLNQSGMVRRWNDPDLSGQRVSLSQGIWNSIPIDAMFFVSAGNDLTVKLAEDTSGKNEVILFNGAVTGSVLRNFAYSDRVSAGRSVYFSSGSGYYLPLKVNSTYNEGV